MATDPMENLIPMNLFKIICVVTWAWLVLTSEIMEVVRGQKHPTEANNDMKELICGKKCLMKVFQPPQKSLSGSNQIWATTSDKKRYITATSIYVLIVEVAVEQHYIPAAYFYLELAF